MPEIREIENQIFEVNNTQEFNALSVEIFHFQYENNSVYQKFVDFLETDIEGIKHYSQIPFLPIELFKKHKILADGFPAEVVFSSSGTTGQQNSLHFVAKMDLYERSFSKGFGRAFGKTSDYIILSLLPSYLEQGNSSLVFMADKLMEMTGHPESNFYLHDYKKLSFLLEKLKNENRKVILLGVTYALLDLAEQYPVIFPDMLLVETGGMKGRRQEMIREELHEKLKKSFGVKKIYSEYGMTELLSQAWSVGEGIFKTPPWMKILIRDMNDPFSLLPEDRSGGINVIDFANLYSCSFIATSDLGKHFSKNTFSVIGRFDHSDVRGCNLMVE